jgi:hypothetical protein
MTAPGSTPDLAPAGHPYRAEIEAERQGWHEVVSLVRSLTPVECLVPGYYRDPDWTVRDIVAHLGTPIPRERGRGERRTPWARRAQDGERPRQSGESGGGGRHRAGRDRGCSSVPARCSARLEARRPDLRTDRGRPLAGRAALVHQHREQSSRSGRHRACAWLATSGPPSGSGLNLQTQHDVDVEHDRVGGRIKREVTPRTVGVMTRSENLIGSPVHSERRRCSVTLTSPAPPQSTLHAARFEEATGVGPAPVSPTNHPRHAQTDHLTASRCPPPVDYSAP